MSGDIPTIKRGRFSALRRLLRDTRGATAIEYGMIVALIVIAMVASFQTLANATVGMWGNVNTKVATATGY